MGFSARNSSRGNRNSGHRLCRSMCSSNQSSSKQTGNNVLRSGQVQRPSLQFTPGRRLRRGSALEGQRGAS